jgi:hypothetical protein
MRFLTPILLLVSLLLLGGCASTKNDIMADYHTRLALHKDTPVVLPGVTPFDDDAAARAMYLEWYRDGYRSGLTGISITCCFPPGPYPSAQQKGWSDGQLQGLSAEIHTRLPASEASEISK